MPSNAGSRITRAFASTILSYVVVVIGTAGTARAQSTSVDSPAYSARSAAMGGTGAADDTDPANMQYNAAVLASAGGLQLTSTFTTWESDRNAFHFGVAGGGSLGSAEQWRSGVALFHPRLDERVPVSGAYKEGVHDSWLHVAGATSLRFGLTRLAIGAAVRESTGEDVSYTRADVGALMALDLVDGESILALALGWGGYEIGAGEGPNGRVGASVRFWSDVRDGSDRPRFGITLNVDAETDRDAISGGLELIALRVLAARAGYRDPSEATGDGWSAGLGAGHRFGHVGIRVDYAYADPSRDSDAHSFGLQLGFSF